VEELIEPEKEKTDPFLGTPHEDQYELILINAFTKEPN